MRLENWQRNALGREVPTRLDGREFRAFAGSSSEMTEKATHPARIPTRPFAGASKVTTLPAAFDVVRDGDAVSFPHCYRNGGDHFLRAIVGELKRRRQAYPSIRERVNAVTMPGELVDLVITEEDAVINPASNSPSLDAFRANAARAGISLISIEALAAKAMTKAKELGPLMPEPDLAGEAVEIVNSDDGAILDVVRQVASGS